MRVSIAVDEQLVPSLTGELGQDPEIEIREVHKDENLADQPFAVGEISIVIAAVKGAAALARTLKRLVDKQTSTSQTLRIETAFGSVTLELREDISMDELHQALEPLFAAA